MHNIFPESRDKNDSALLVGLSVAVTLVVAIGVVLVCLVIIRRYRRLRTEEHVNSAIEAERPNSNATTIRVVSNDYDTLSHNSQIVSTTTGVISNGYDSLPQYSQIADIAAERIPNDNGTLPQDNQRNKVSYCSGLSYYPALNL